MLPLEALQAARQIRIAGCSEEERAKLVALVRALQTLITRISHLLSGRDMLLEIAEQILKPQSERLEIEFKQMLDAFAECFRQGNCRFQLPTVRGALTEMDDAIQQIRDRNMLADLPLEAPLRVLDLVERYHATGEALEESGDWFELWRFSGIGAIMHCSRRTQHACKRRLSKKRRSRIRLERVLRLAGCLDELILHQTEKGSIAGRTRRTAPFTGRVGLRLG